MRMRYYRKLPVSILPTAILVIFFRHFLEYHSLPSALLNGLLGGVLMALILRVLHSSWYWEIGDDRLIHRRYFSLTVFPFSEITYIGPMIGEASTHKFFDKTILVRNAVGKRMFVTTVDPETFLDQMRKHLPQITLHL
jgi:hypothetical protein